MERVSKEYSANKHCKERMKEKISTMAARVYAEVCPKNQGFMIPYETVE
jgi:hypothetical protein